MEKIKRVLKNKKGLSDRERFLEEKKLVRDIPLPEEMLGSRELTDDEFFDVENLKQKELVKEKAEKNEVFEPDELAQGEVEELESMFGGEGQTESSILKELFNMKNIDVKTELSGDEVSIISRLELMSVITKRPYLKVVLNRFKTLRVSKDRQSRKEFVEAHKDRQTAKNQGLFGGLLGGGQQ